jgi:hypothetical protein
MSQRIMHDGKSYIVFNLTFKNKDVPIILDYADMKFISRLDKTWCINDSGAVVCHHILNGKQINIYLHEVVMALKLKDAGHTSEYHPIVHINRLGIDNRRDNLIYDKVDKELSKNLKKKRRIIDLPEESGIDPDELPTYVWYLKPNGSHGDRFVVEVGSTIWKTTSSTKHSLRYKLEEAKKFLRHLKIDDPALFHNHCMNGEFIQIGKDLLDSFYDIALKAGYNHLKRVSTHNITDKYLENNYDSLSDDERVLLDSVNN